MTLASCGKENTQTVENYSNTGSTENLTPNEETENMNDYQTKGFENGDIVAVMKTTNGTMKIKLFTEDVPKTTLNFIIHAQEGYYDGLIFHRVINNFMIQ